MYGRLSLPVAALVVLLLTLPVGASAQNHSGSAGTITYKSRGCKGPVNQKQYRFETYACATITVPVQSVVGQPVTITFKFRAKTRLTNVKVCFAWLDGRKCANPKQNYGVIPSGHTIKYVLKAEAPQRAGTVGAYNSTAFFKPPKNADKSLYWSVPAYERVVAS
jgi:hypothetical protein